LKFLVQVRSLVAGLTGALGKLAIVLMMLHIGADLVLRLLLGSAPEGMPETVARVYMVACVFLPMALVQHQGRQIEVTYFVESMPGWLAAIANIFSNLVTGATAALLAWLCWGVAIEATQLGERVDLLNSSIPVWPTRWAMFAGFVALFLVALMDCLVGLATAASPANGKE
jgi:TRAP-type C4-dicarboxylate transport system permease small subunit